MRVFLRRFLIAFFVFALLVGGFFLWIQDKYVVPILMYHEIEDIGRHEANYVTPKNFERQMAFFAKNKYNVISLDALIESIKQGNFIPKNSVVISFDDGVENNYTNALGVLKKYDFPAIVFVPSSLIGKTKQMSAAQLQEMIHAGIDIGSHTQTHAYLPDLSFEEQRREIFDSKKDLEESLGIPIKYFAYPIGGFSDEIKEIVRQAGYEGACATNRGYDRFNKDVFELKRIRPNNNDSDFVLWIKTSGYYNLFRKSKKSY